MNTNTPEMKKAAIEATEALKMINAAYKKQKQQVEEMYAFFNELLTILSNADAKGNKEVKELTWSIRTALMTYMLRIKSIGEKE
jgi:hypothetical protein